MYISEYFFYIQWNFSLNLERRIYNIRILLLKLNNYVALSARLLKIPFISSLQKKNFHPIKTMLVIRIILNIEISHKRVIIYNVMSHFIDYWSLTRPRTRLHLIIFRCCKWLLYWFYYTHYESSFARMKIKARLVLGLFDK